MEFPKIKNRIMTIQVRPMNKDQSTSKSISLLDKKELGSQIYRLKGNEKVLELQRYKELMKKYMDHIAGQDIIISARKEVKLRKGNRGFRTPSELVSSQSKRFYLNQTPPITTSFTRKPRFRYL